MLSSITRLFPQPVRVQPTDALASAIIIPAVEVEIRDTFGNLITGATNAVTLAIGVNPAAGTLGGTLTVGATAGVATFSDLSLDKLGVGYTLTASATGLTGAASNPFTINNGPAAVLTLDAGDLQQSQVGTALPQSLSVKVTDAGSNPVSGVTVTWTVTGGGGTLTQPTTMTDAAGLASNQLQVGSAYGANNVDASVAGLSGSPVLFSALGTPAGMTKLWDGTTTDWGTVSNWTPIGVPTASDNVFVHAGPANQPVLGANQSVGDLWVESTATLNVSSFTLTASGNVEAGTTIVGSGSVDLSGSAKTVMGTLPNLVVSGDISLAGATTVNGNVTISGTGANLTLNGHMLTVTGNFTTQTSGVVTMSNVADALTVTGNATFNGGISTLSAGQITLQGNFSQASQAQSFGASGTHSTLFNGTTAQTIFFNNPGATSSRFQSLTLDNAAGASFTSTAAHVLGTVTLTATSGAVTGTTVTIDGNLVDSPGSSWQSTNTTFTGSPTLPANMTTNLTFTGAATLGANLTLTGNLTVSGGGADLILNGKTVVVGGNFTTQTSGVVTMSNVADALTVTGNATFNGGISTLSAGQITLQGNFSQASQAQSFGASGTHSTLFNGTTAQTIFFNNPGATSSRFQSLTLDNAAGASFTSTAAHVLGTVTLTATSGAVTGTTVTIDGNLVDSPGSSWQSTNTTFTGSPTLPANMTTNLTFTGAATLGANLTLTGNLTVSGGGADLILNGKTVVVGGNFTTQTSGVVTMSNVADALTVTGNATFNGGISTLSAGQITLQGNFSQASQAQSFGASGTHSTLFNGTTAQTIFFNNPGATSSRFQSLTLDNAAGASFTSTAAHVLGTVTLTATSGAVTGTTVTIDGNLVDSPGSSWQSTNTTFTGSPTLPANMTTNLTFTGAATLGANLTVTGNLTVSGGGADLILNGKTVVVGGNFTTQTSGVVTMSNVADALTVTGNATFNGGISTLSAGQITLQGNFSQASQAQSFGASGTHSTLFNGTTAQTIFFNNPGATSSRFQSLTLDNAAGASFTSTAAHVLGTVTLTATSCAVTGTTVTIDGDLVDTPGSSWQSTNTTFTGSPTLPANMTTNLTFTGAATLGANLTLTGNLTVSGGGADLILNGKTVVVGGNFTTQTSGVVTMSNVADALTVTGNATFNGGISTLSAGQITLQGNFSQASQAQSFGASGTHSTLFNGTTAQTIFFNNPGATSSRFQSLTLDNAAGASFTSTAAHVLSTVTLTATSGAVTGTTVTIDGNLVDSPGSSWQSTNTTFTGSPTLPANMTTNLTFTGAATLGANLTLTGNLTVSGGGADLILNGKTVVVGGNFTTQTSGVVTMSNVADALTVTGNATFNGGISTLSAGQITLQGNFSQASQAQSFAASGTHSTRFNGTVAQTISFSNPSATNSRFQDLEIVNGVSATVTFASNVFADGQLIRTTLDGTNRVINGGGFLLTAKGFNASELTFDNLRVAVIDGDVIGTINNIIFQNMVDTQVQFAFTRSLGTVSIGTITFNTAPNTGLGGRYLTATDNDIGNGALTIQLGNPTPGAVGAETEKFGEAIITWPFP